MEFVGIEAGIASRASPEFSRGIGEGQDGDFLAQAQGFGQGWVHRDGGGLFDQPDRRGICRRWKRSRTDWESDQIGGSTFRIGAESVGELIFGGGEQDFCFILQLRFDAGVYQHIVPSKKSTMTVTTGMSTLAGI